MKVTVKFKNDNSGEKDGRKWRMLHLLCSVDNPNDANEIAIHGSKSGVPKDAIEKLIKLNDYNGKITYQFKLQCSLLTFEKVERYGVLDIKVENIEIKYDGKYVNSKIKVIEKIEQIDGYEAPENYDSVSGWNVPAPTAQVQSTEPPKSQGEPIPVTDFSKIIPPNENDLPF